MLFLFEKAVKAFREVGENQATLTMAQQMVVLRREAELEGATPDGVLDGILASVPVPR